MKKKVLFTSKLPGDDFKNLLQNEKYEVTILADRERDTLCRTVKSFDPDAIVSLLSDKIDKELIDIAPSLKVVSNYAVGYNNIDVPYCSEKGIIVTNTPGVLTDATADIAFMLILMVSRRAGESERFTRNGYFKEWMPELLVGKSLQNKTLGIVGLGRIGYATAKRAEAFGMNIIYHNRKRVGAEKESMINARFVSLNDLLTESDVISLHIPYMPEVHHLIGEKELKMMKKSTILVNTARGPLVHEKALAEALSQKTIYGAGLDVYEFEPEIEEGLKSLENIVLLPHIGSATEETRYQMAKMVINDLMLVLGEKEPVNFVNR